VTIRDQPDAEPHRLSRRTLLAVGAGAVGVAAAAIVGIGELVDHGVLPGQSILNDLDGACSLSVPTPKFGPVGRQINGSFYSQHRHREVGYSIGLPEGFTSSDPVPLTLFLHGEGRNHRTHLGNAGGPAKAAALMVDGISLPPMAIATIDGGEHYWHDFNGDDPLAMLVQEFIPRCQQLGLGVHKGTVGAMGLSMGGYGALLAGELHPEVFSAVAGLSPAIWTSYDEANGANQQAYSSAANFRQFDAVTHTGSLAQTPTFIASGDHDPFYPGALAFRAALPASTPVVANFGAGCHGGDFFNLHLPGALSFINAHLHASTRP
jgi:S-formylglutathione hydrolase FrmB